MTDDTWIQTFRGIEFHPLNPSPNDVHMIDIAHALSNKCRFAGHTLDFYSVAQHSVLVADQLEPEFKLWGLLHDAAEAYFADIPRPIKRAYPLFNEIEDKILEAVANRYDLKMPIPKCVKEADNILLATEVRDLLPKPWRGYEEQMGHLALKDVITPLAPLDAEKLFLKEFLKLMEEKQK